MSESVTVETTAKKTKLDNGNKSKVKRPTKNDHTLTLNLTVFFWNTFGTISINDNKKRVREREKSLTVGAIYQSLTTKKHCITIVNTIEMKNCLPLVLVTSVMKHIVVSQEKVNQKTVWPRSCSRLTKSGGDKSSL